MIAEWIQDAARVPNDDILMRRLLRRHPHHVPDLITGRLIVSSSAAFRHDDDSGISTQSEALLPLTGRTRADIYDWSNYNGYQFPVGGVRATKLAGVVYEPDPEDEELGRAHALVRAPVARPSKPMRRDIAAAIAEICIPMPEDPNPQ